MERCAIGVYNNVIEMSWRANLALFRVFMNVYEWYAHASIGMSFGCVVGVEEMGGGKNA